MWGAQEDSYWRVIWTEADANDPKLCGARTPPRFCTSCALALKTRGVGRGGAAALGVHGGGGLLGAALLLDAHHPLVPPARARTAPQAARAPAATVRPTPLSLHLPSLVVALSLILSGCLSPAAGRNWLTAPRPHLLGTVAAVVQGPGKAGGRASARAAPLGAAASMCVLLVRPLAELSGQFGSDIRF